MRRLIAALLLVLPALARAENARLPYHYLYLMEKTESDLARTYTNLIVTLRMEPTAPGSKVGELQVYIDAKAGHIPIAVQRDGGVVIPMRDDLLAEDPWIVANQPKGTVELDWWIALVETPPPNPVSYARLMQPVRDSAVVQARMREVMPSAGKVNLTGLKLMFPTNAAPIAIIHARSGPRKLAPNGSRAIFIPLDTALLDENPDVTFSPAPEGEELSSDDAAH